MRLRPRSSPSPSSNREEHRMHYARRVANQLQILTRSEQPASTRRSLVYARARIFALIVDTLQIDIEHLLVLNNSSAPLKRSDRVVVRQDKASELETGILFPSAPTPLAMTHLLKILVPLVEHARVQFRDRLRVVRHRARSGSFAVGEILRLLFYGLDSVSHGRFGGCGAHCSSTMVIRLGCEGVGEESVVSEEGREKGISRFVTAEVADCDATEGRHLIVTVRVRWRYEAPGSEMAGSSVSESTWGARSSRRASNGGKCISEQVQ